MTKVKVTTSAAGRIPFLKLTPGGNGVLDDFQFFCDDDTKEADWWVVVEGLKNDESVLCPAENTILVAHENEFMKDYDRKFLKQFHRVITCHQTMRHPRKIYTQQAHHSHLFWTKKEPGVSMEEYHNRFRTYDELKAIKQIPKTKLLSAVASGKTRTAGQKKRNDFIRKMKEHFKDRMDAWSYDSGAFGPETLIPTNKWNSIAPYKYYLAIENSFVPHYWTSNIGDAYTAGAYPIYFGHPSVLDYFPKNALTIIDINDIPGSIKTIEKIIAENYFEKYQKEIWQARDLVLDRYNLFPMLKSVIENLPAGTKKQLITLHPENKRPLKFKIHAILERSPILLSGARRVYNLVKKFRS